MSSEKGEGEENTLNAKITGRKDIHTLQTETSEHLDRPSTEATPRGKFLKHLVVAGSNEHVGTEMSVHELLRQTVNVFRLSTG